MKEIEIKIRDIRDSLAKGDLPPGVAVSHLNELAALLGNVNSEIRLADLAYSKVLYECLSEDGKANIAKIKAEISEEHQIARRWKDVRELVKEMIGSLKYYVKEKADERKITN